MDCPNCRSSMQVDGARILATGCGHLFHESCLRAWIRRTNPGPAREGTREFSCPECREEQLEMNCHRVFLANLPTVPAANASLDQGISAAMASKNAEILRLTRELGRVRLQLRDTAEAGGLPADEPGSRLGMHNHGGRVYKGSFDDATCLNCESSTHITRECPNQCILRSVEQTIFDKWTPLAPYKFLAEMPGPMAGAIVSLFEVDHHLGQLSRAGLQIVFATHFFGDACWRCGSPYHVHLDCSVTPDPGLKTLARKVHLIVKPLTEEQRKAKLERHEANIRARAAEHN